MYNKLFYIEHLCKLSSYLHRDDEQTGPCMTFRIKYKHRFVQPHTTYIHTYIMIVFTVGSQLHKSIVYFHSLDSRVMSFYTRRFREFRFVEIVAARPAQKHTCASSFRGTVTAACCDLANSSLNPVTFQELKSIV
jgi:hypothetical protein